MKNRTHTDHPSAEQLQALLERELPERDLAAVEEHLAACGRCAAELDAWRVLVNDLTELPRYAPGDGFAARVLAGVPLTSEVSWPQRVRERFGMAGGGRSEHVAPEVLQDFLDGSLAARSSHRVESHLRGCRACSGEAEAWASLLARLERLDAFAPSEGFRQRVLAEVRLPQRAPLAARIRGWVAGLRPADGPEHVPAGILQDFVDGALPQKAMARIEAHVRSCGVCASEAAAWRSVVGRLDALERPAPSPAFADAVMARLRAGESHALVPSRSAAWARRLAAASRWIPQTREAWAALSGVAVTPVVIVGLVVYTVFSHPTLTVGSLASFAWWQVTDLLGASLQSLGTVIVERTEVFGLYTLVEFLASAPALVVGAVVAYSMLSALALRVLYKNLHAPRPSNGRRTHVPATS